MKDAFRYYLKVRYSECDMQKVVFNSRYGDYIDIATTEFLRTLDQDIEYQVVKQTVEWKAPARYDNVLELAVALKSLGTTSFTLVTEISRAGTEQRIVNAETVYVLLDRDTMQKKSLSTDYRAALEEGACGVRVDHAGYLGRTALKDRPQPTFVAPA